MKRIIFLIIFLSGFCEANELVDSNALGKLEYKVLFSNSKFDNERKAVRELNIEDINSIEKLDWNMKDYQILIDKYDINNDKIEDVIVFFNGYYFCGSKGCLTEIYLGNNMKRIFHVNTYGKISILPREHHGYKDLKISTSNGFTMWVWDGANYKVSEANM